MCEKEIQLVLSLLRIFYRVFGLVLLWPLLYSFWHSWNLPLPGQGKVAVTSMVSPHKYFCPIKLDVQERLYYVFYYSEAVRTVAL